MDFMLPNIKGILLKRLFFLALICLWQTGFGQQEESYVVGAKYPHLVGKKWMPLQNVGTLKWMKLNYKKPDGLKEASSPTEFFEPNSKLALMFNGVFNKLSTEEGDFIAFMPVYAMLTPEAIADWRKIIPNFKYEIDQLHISQVRHIVKCGFGEKAAEEWRKHVTYYSADDAKSKFNADTAITISLKLDSTEYYKDKYQYLDVLLIQKKERGYVFFCCFYDENGKKNLAKYRKALEGALRYDD